MDKVIDFINVNRDRYLTELKALLAIPSISALPEHARRRQTVRRLVRRRDAADWPAERQADRDAGQSGRVRRLAGRAGRADDSLLRPLRRAACRSAGALALAAVRGDHPRRRNLRARRGRRQGAGVHALQGGRSALEAERPPAGEHEVHDRRRGGSRQRASRRLRPLAQEGPGGRRRRDLGLRRCSRAACRRSATGFAAWCTSRSISAAATPTCTRARSAAPSRTRRSCSPRCSRR